MQRWIVVAWAGIVLGLATGSAVVILQKHLKEKRSFRELASHNRAGQTQEEVTRIRGCPPGDYGGGQRYNVKPLRPLRSPTHKIMSWDGLDVSVQVEFDSEGKVVGFRKREVLPPGVVW